MQIDRVGAAVTPWQGLVAEQPNHCGDANPKSLIGSTRSTHGLAGVDAPLPSHLVGAFSRQPEPSRSLPHATRRGPAPGLQHLGHGRGGDVALLDYLDWEEAPGHPACCGAGLGIP